MGNIEWAQKKGVSFRLHQGELAAQLDRIMAKVAIDGAPLDEKLDYLCLCVRAGTEHLEKTHDEIGLGNQETA